MRASLAFSLLSLLALAPTSLCSPAPVANPDALAEAEAIADPEAFANPEPVALPEADSIDQLEARDPAATGAPTCPTAGAGCGTNGKHKCSCNKLNILVCNGRNWELAAKCGAAHKCEGTSNGPHCG